MKGIITPIFIFNTKIKEDRNHQIAKAQLSHIKTLAGLILNRKKAIKMAIKITTVALEIYVPDIKVIIDKTRNIIVINPPASQSNPSVMLIALTIAIVTKKVNTGAKIHRSISPAIGRKLIVLIHNLE